MCNFPLLSPKCLFTLGYSNQDPAKVLVLHLVDGSLKSLLIYNSPFSLIFFFHSNYLLAKPGHLPYGMALWCHLIHSSVPCTFHWHLGLKLNLIQVQFCRQEYIVGVLWASYHILSGDTYVRTFCFWRCKDRTIDSSAICLLPPPFGPFQPSIDGQCQITNFIRTAKRWFSNSTISSTLICCGSSVKTDFPLLDSP